MRSIMFRTALACALLCLVSGMAVAQNALPQPDAKGSYQGRYLHPYWVVVDPDPNGFNGRLSPKWPANWDAVDANWPDTRVIKPDWPVVVRFNQGRILSARYGNMGNIFVRDGNGSSWLLVSSGPARPNGVCFVRANRKFMKPVLVRESGANLPVADARGNFTAIGGLQRHWKVVGNGLRGRLAMNWPANWDAMNANWPDTTQVAQWPLANHFAKGEILLAAIGNRGIIQVRDAAGNPWILVTTGPGPSGCPTACFIPANRQFIQPVAITHD